MIKKYKQLPLGEKRTILSALFESYVEMTHLNLSQAQHHLFMAESLIGQTEELTEVLKTLDAWNIFRAKSLVGAILEVCIQETKARDSDD